MYFKINTHQVKLLSMLLLVISVFSFAQKSKEEEIDAEIEKANKLYMHSKVKELLLISKNILARSEKLKYEKGLVYGNFYIGGALFDIGQFKESIKYIHKSQMYTDYLKTDPMQNSRNHGALGDNFLALDLYSLSYQNFKKSIDDINETKDKTDVLLATQGVNYAMLAEAYEIAGKQDSAYHYFNKAKKILGNLDFEDIFIEKSDCYIRIGDYFLNTKQGDSALFYYEKALSVLDGKKQPYQTSALIGLGNFYNQQNKVEEAINYYSKAIEITKEHSYSDLIYAYKGLEEVYEKQGDFRNARVYNALFNKTNDSIENAKKIDRDFVVSEVMRLEKDAEVKRNHARIMKVSIIVGICIVLAVMVLFYYIKRKGKELINERETIIHQKEEEKHELKLRVNESFEEVIQLAKTNSPEFLGRFQEVYPEFTSRLLSINSELKPSELILSAYIYLGFTTKDIADYTFKAVKTIKNNKYNLRKRLEIPTKDDFTIWMRNEQN